MKTEDLKKRTKQDLSVIAGMMGLSLKGNESKQALIDIISAAADGQPEINPEKYKPSKGSAVKKRGRPKKNEEESAATEKTPEPKDKKEKRTDEKKTSGKNSDEKKTNVAQKVPDEVSLKKKSFDAETDEKKVIAERENKSQQKRRASRKTDSVKEKQEKELQTTEKETAESTQTVSGDSDANVANKEAVAESVAATEELSDSTEADASATKRGEFKSAGDVVGILEIMADGYGFLRAENFCNGPKDVYVPPLMIKRFSLRNGDCIKGKTKLQKDQSVSQALIYINEINDKPLDQLGKRVVFEQLIPVYPDSKLVLEKDPTELSTRIIDMFAPIGKGQRGLIVSPPKAGKTVLLKKIANSISENYPEVELIVLLIDERPEEVTDMRESVKGTVVSSTFDELPERHIKVSELVLERAQRLVEQGRDVVILMDSLTRLARAYNLTIPPTGRSLSGGLDPGALHKPKKFFGAARNIRGGGSLTIVATALVDTGSRLDDVIFEEFKGTGNMELHLDRKLSEKRIFPAIDISKSGTRKEELLLTDAELNAIYSLRKAISNIGAADATDMIIDKLAKSKTNESFISNLKTELPKS